VEDFRRDTRSVDDVRRARFGGGWIQTPDGTWRPLTQARFTASRAAWEARDNIDAGTDGPDFFLATGGTTTRHTELNGTVRVTAPQRTRPADLPAERAR
jgi:hypothetical protein